MVADMEVDKLADIFANVVADKKKKNKLSDMELDMVADMEVDKERKIFFRGEYFRG